MSNQNNRQVISVGKPSKKGFCTVIAGDARGMDLINYEFIKLYYTPCSKEYFLKQEAEQKKAYYGRN